MTLASNNNSQVRSGLLRGRTTNVPSNGHSESQNQKLDTEPVSKFSWLCQFIKAMQRHWPAMRKGPKHKSIKQTFLLVCVKVRDVHKSIAGQTGCSDQTDVVPSSICLENKQKWSQKHVYRPTMHARHQNCARRRRLRAAQKLRAPAVMAGAAFAPDAYDD